MKEQIFIEIALYIFNYLECLYLSLYSLGTSISIYSSIINMKKINSYLMIISRSIAFFNIFLLLDISFINLVITVFINSTNVKFNKLYRFFTVNFLLHLLFLPNNSGKETKKEFILNSLYFTRIFRKSI